MLRIVCILFISANFLVSCASTTSKEQKKLDEVPDIKTEQDDARYKSFNIGYRNVGKVLSFYLDPNGSIKHVCISDKCRQSYTKWRRSIHVDTSFNYSPSLYSFSANHLALCGSGDGKALVNHEIQTTLSPSAYKQFSQLSREIPRGKHNWNALYKDLCYSDYLTGTSTFQIAETIACVMLAGICLVKEDENIHKIVEFREIRFKNDILRSGVDQLATALLPMLRQFARNSVEHIKVVTLKDSGARSVFEQTASELNVFNARYDGFVVIEKGSAALLGSAFFTGKAEPNKTFLETVMKRFESNLRNQSAMYDQAFISSLIPPKISKPALPTIPNLIKDEFEKIADFERRVEQAASEREQKVRAIDRNYKLAVYRRNAYIKALETAYHKHIERLEANRLAKQKDIVESKAQLSQLVMKLLYSDIKITNMSYDAEEERLYVEMLSRRNRFQQSAIFALEPTVAKAIKTGRKHDIGLNVELMAEGVAVTGGNLLHENKLYVGGFTDIQFEPMEMYVEVSAVDPEFKEKQKETLSKYIQQEAFLEDMRVDESYNVYVRTKFNRRKPEWFVRPSKQGDNIVVTGQSDDSRNAAILDAKVTLAGFIQAEVEAVTLSKQVVEGSRFTTDLFQQEAKSTSRIELGNYDVKMIRDNEIDGWHYVMLQCAAPCKSIK